MSSLSAIRIGKSGTYPEIATVRPQVEWWPRLAMFMVIGYFIMGRSFSYLGFAPAKIFIGEVVLAAFLFGRPKEGVDRIKHALAHPGPLSDYGWGIVALLLYGLFEVCRGLYAGYSAITAIQCMVFNYYPLYLLLGIWLGERDKDFTRRLIVRLAWWNGIYGVIYVAFLNRVTILMPGTSDGDVHLFGQPWGSPIALLGLICLDRDFKRDWLPLLLNSAVLLGMQVRAEWTAFVVGLVIYTFLTGRFEKLIGVVSATALLLVIGLVADIKIPAPSTRGFTISSREIIGRAVAPISTELAAEFTENAGWHAATFEWRTKWWKAIWEDNHKNTLTALLGGGYGYPLAKLVSYLRNKTDLRTPHNMFLFALGYGGWALVGLFALLQFFVCRLLLQAYRLNRNPFGLVFFGAVIVWSLFGDSFETPYGAIPFFVTAGTLIGAIFRRPNSGCGIRCGYHSPGPFSEKVAYPRDKGLREPLSA